MVFMSNVNETQLDTVWDYLKPDEKVHFKLAIGGSVILNQFISFVLCTNLVNSTANVTKTKVCFMFFFS